MCTCKMYKRFEAITPFDLKKKSKKLKKTDPPSWPQSCDWMLWGTWHSLTVQWHRAEENGLHVYGQFWTKQSSKCAFAVINYPSLWPTNSGGSVAIAAGFHLLGGAIPFELAGFLLWLRKTISRTAGLFCSGRCIQEIFFSYFSRLYIW